MQPPGSQSQTTNLHHHSHPLHHKPTSKNMLDIYLLRFGFSKQYIIAVTAIVVGGIVYYTAKGLWWVGKHAVLGVAEVASDGIHHHVSSVDDNGNLVCLCTRQRKAERARDNNSFCVLSSQRHNNWNNPKRENQAREEVWYRLFHRMSASPLKKNASSNMRKTCRWLKQSLKMFVFADWTWCFGRNTECQNPNQSTWEKDFHHPSSSAGQVSKETPYTPNNTINHHSSFEPSIHYQSSPLPSIVAEEIWYQISPKCHRK